MASKLQVMKYRKWNNCCAEQNSPPFGLCAVYFKGRWTAEWWWVCFQLHQCLSYRRKEMQDFPLRFQLHTASWVVPGWCVPMGLCLIFRWHNTNGMRVGRAQVPLGWTRRMCWGQEHGRLMGMRMRKSTGPFGMDRDSPCWGWEHSGLVGMPPHFLLHYDTNLIFF